MQVTTDQVWEAAGGEKFGVVGYVTARGEARTAGIVYAVRDRKIYFSTESNAWKTRHLRKNPSVSMTIPIAKRIPFVPWVKVPAATITFSGTAKVLEVSDAPAGILDALLEGLEGAEALKQSCAVVEIAPAGDFLTCGVGVSLGTMRDPAKAGGRAPDG